jgi:hypothetical protein
MPMTLQHGPAFLRTAFGLALLLGAAAATWAADVPPPAMAPGKESRAHMATMHEQMASCLRSDKPMADCRAEMMKACQAMSPTEGCQMGGRGKGKHAGPGQMP